MIKNGRRGTLSGTLDRAGRAGAHRVSAPRAQSRSTSSRRRWPSLRATRWDGGNEYFPPTTLPVLEHPRGHGCDQRDSRDARGAVQLPLLDRRARASRSRSASRTSCAGTASTTTLRVDRLGQAVPHAARHARRRRLGGDRRGDRRDAGALVHRRHVRRPLHRATSATRSSSSVRSTPRSTRSNERVRVADLEPLAAIYGGILDRLLVAGAMSAGVGRARP